MNDKCYSKIMWMLGVMCFPLLNLSLNKQPALHHKVSLTPRQIKTHGHNKKIDLSSNLKCWQTFVDRKRGVFGEDFFFYEELVVWL